MDYRALPVIINGKGIKSVNQFYNKLKANSKAKSSNNRYFRLNNLAFKKECKINDFIHKAGDLIVKHCLEYKIANIIIGKNKEWKQEINLGKKTNLNFTSIPYQSFIEKLSYKSALNNINFTLTEESYTSKCDPITRHKISKLCDSLISS
ncbi:IS200/IS605 family accessory protein TnpB-related protein [Campylobacter hyointestinalis]|uniref:IS200/IS605 family accessory protein TnpB-related protein n=1 Tax=Campylobacter hyointestinalis TaxID=198 RepID=UPI000DCCEDCC|nr:IS200/IS605 family accessory protein TnpB-related protein [Campylobacter hyointestinalis]RAZ49511.1 hypothetical protein CHL9004_06365 [Campylobacter hyointestinalis subsp. lawsonii]